MSIIHKATNASELHRVTLAGQPRGFEFWPESPRPTLHEIVRRYGRWVHRLVAINADACAAIRPRLFTIGQREAVQKCARLGPKPLDNRTKAYLKGNDTLRPCSRVMRKMHGNVDDMTEITSHPALDLLENVNPWDEPHAYRKAIYADLQIFGRHFTFVVGQPQPTELWRIMPQYVKAIPSATTFVGGFEYQRGTVKVTYSPDEVFWLRQFDPDDPWGGIGWVGAWLKTIDSDFAITDFTDWMFKRGGMPDVVVTTPAPLGDDAKRAFRVDWRRLFGRARNREENVAFIGGKDVKVETFAHTPKEMEYKDSRALIRDELCAASGVPKSYLTTDDVNRANATEGNPTHIRVTVWPMVMQVEEAINQRLLPKWSDRLVMVHENPLVGDTQTIISNRESRLRSGWSINEVRTDEGAESLDDPNADMPLVTSAVSTLDRVVNPPDPLDGFGFGGIDEEDDAELDDAEEDDKALGAVVSKMATTIERLAEAVSRRRSPVGHTHARDVKQSDLLIVKDKREDRPQRLLPASGASRAFIAEIEAILHRHVRSVAEAMTGQSVSAAEAILDDPRWREMIADAARPFLDRAAMAGGKDALSQLPDRPLPPTAPAATAQGDLPAARLPSNVVFDATNPRVQEFVDQYTARFAQEVAGNTQASLRSLIGDGISKGETIPDLAKRVMEYDEAITPHRAEMIARTESARAYTTGQEQAWKETGLVEGKQWLLSPDACEFCEAAAAQFGEGTTTPLGQAFYAKGTVLTSRAGNRLTLDYSDVTGAPLHPNCRCAVMPVLVDVGG